MSNGRDILRAIRDHLLAHDDSITEELWLTVEREIRDEYGGQEYYIGTREKKTPDELAEKVMKDVLTDMSTKEITKRHGISRATMYRLMKRPKTGET
jgi:Mor family transcriptional regulator